MAGAASRTCALPGMLIDRVGVRHAVEELLPDRAGLQAVVKALGESSRPQPESEESCQSIRTRRTTKSSPRSAAVTGECSAIQMSYRWVEHTAELELEIEAATEDGVFRDAVRALGEILADDRRGERVQHDLAVEGAERALLLAGCLDELVYLAETEDLVPEEIEGIALSDRGLAAIVRGHRGNPRHVVKGITYHRLAFERLDKGFRAVVIIDV